MLDESEGNYRQSFPPSFDNRTDCRTMFFERNQIETGVQNLVYEYIVEKRMEMAYRLLQSGKYKVKDVVWMVGYTNASHFIDAFKKRYGVTPGEI